MKTELGLNEKVPLKVPFETYREHHVQKDKCLPSEEGSCIVPTGPYRFSPCQRTMLSSVTEEIVKWV